MALAGRVPFPLDVCDSGAVWRWFTCVCVVACVLLSALRCVFRFAFGGVSVRAPLRVMFVWCASRSLGLTGRLLRLYAIGVG